MKKFTLSTMLVLLFFMGTFAQNAHQIVNDYLKYIGADELMKLENMKSSGISLLGGQEFPFIAYSSTGGRMKVDVVIQGTRITLRCFDGNNGWSQNFLTLKSEKWEEEMNAYWKVSQDFPEALINYEEKGYSISYEGIQELEGVECHKIKLVMKPFEFKGEKKEVSRMYYFDGETGVPFMYEESSFVGPNSGTTIQNYLSDYRKTSGGFILPMRIVQKSNGIAIAEIRIDKVEIETDIPETFFRFPKSPVTPHSPEEN